MGTYGITTSGLGAMGQSARVDQIANNLANVSTPGFRRDTISFRERLVEALEDRPDLQHYNAMVDRHGGAPFIDAVGFDRRPGPYDQTGRSLDFALQGPGFFTVRDIETEKVYYTRAGNFTLDARGRLVTADGRYEVMTADGRPLELESRGSSEIRVSGDGKLSQGDIEIGRLAIADFADYSLLGKHGDNLFDDRGAGVVEPGQAVVEQGWIEGSSVNPVVEMVEMIRALRALETNLEMVRMQDSTLDRTVNDFGRVPR